MMSGLVGQSVINIDDSIVRQFLLQGGDGSGKFTLVATGPSPSMYQEQHFRAVRPVGRKVYIHSLHGIIAIRYIDMAGRRKGFIKRRTAFSPLTGSKKSHSE